MSYFNISNFQTQIRTRGVAKPNRFEILMPPPTALKAVLDYPQLITLFCDSASLPVRNINVKQQRIQGPAYQRPMNVDYGGDNISMSFIVDREMDIKGFFDAWMNIIINPNEYYVHYQSTYVTSIRISQLDEYNKETYAVVLEDAFPRSVSMLDLNSSTQNSSHRLNVSFAYRRWWPQHRAIDKINLPYNSIEQPIVAAWKPAPTVQLFSVPSPEFEVRSQFSSGYSPASPTNDDRLFGRSSTDAYWVKGQRVTEQEYRIFQSAPTE
jgi:hypothetical protein